ncbi:MAG: hypothetical protein H6Q27_241 [Ignavibacteriaceae bacterium]|nr:hypothetical protein [Ignavibacteriaceae bacterium]
MNLEKVVSTLKRKKYLIISEAELNELLSKSELLLEENTYLSDKIRLLKYNDDLLIQEKSTKEEFLVRRMNTKKEAEDLIKERLDIYNRMWDGCGCKIDYYK